MLWAAAITLVSVGGGVALAFLPRGRDVWIGPVRTFALTAALSVVLLHLLPEALGAVGAWAFLVFVAGLLAPEALGKGGAALWRLTRGPEARSGEQRERHLALEAGYFGLLLHRVGDGVGLGAFTGEMQAWSGSGGVMAAMAAHAVPVVAIVVLTFDSVRGRDSALRRAVGLGLASMAGVFLARGLPAHAFAMASPWIAAFVSGMLLHVVTHDVEAQLPKTPRARLFDFMAGGAGIFVSFIGHDAHAVPHAPHAEGRVFAHLLLFALELAPVLLLGLLCAALLRLVASRQHPVGGTAGKWSTRVAYLAGTPELSVVSLALGVRFLGWEFSLVRFVAALGLTWVLARWLRPNDMRMGGTQGPVVDDLVQALRELIEEVGPFIVLALVVSILFERFMPPLAHSEGRFVLQTLVVLGVAFFSHVDAAAAMLLAAVLIDKGMLPGALLIALLVGPITNAPRLRIAANRLGKGVFALVAVFIGLSYAVGVGYHLTDRHPPLVDFESLSPPGLLSISASALIGALLLRSIYVRGLRGFFGVLGGHHTHESACADAGSMASAHGHAHGQGQQL